MLVCCTVELQIRLARKKKHLRALENVAKGASYREGLGVIPGQSMQDLWWTKWW